MILMIITLKKCKDGQAHHNFTYAYTAWLQNASQKQHFLNQNNLACYLAGPL